MLPEYMKFLLFTRIVVFGSLIYCVVLIQGCAPTTNIARGSAEDILAEQRKQQALYLDTIWNRQARLADLAWPLMKNGTELCGNDVKIQFGILPIAIETIHKDYRDVAEAEHQISDRPSVLHVMRDSPAMLAGIQAGDEFISVAGDPVDSGKKSLTSLMKQLTTASEAGTPVVFELARVGVTKSYTVSPVQACSYNVLLSSDDILNAFADGNSVYITQGMMRFAENDEELQLVIAHEIAHNSEGHVDKSLGNRLLGALVDLAAAAYGVNTQAAFSKMGASIFSQEFEREADYVGMYLMARAGVSTKGVSNFWRLMAAEHPQNIKGTYSSTHPATAERYTNIDAAHDEIQDKLLKNFPLLPERK